MYFRTIRKDTHYVQHHERQVPWSEVIAVLLQGAKHLRKKGTKIELEWNGYYLLCEIRDRDLYVINAKRTS